MKKEYGLVLAGGGTKGSYQVGAWKALKQLDVYITSVVGASIGALNGALILQDDFEKMQSIYDKIEIENIIDIKGNINKDKNIFDIKNLVNIAKDFTIQKGFTNDALRDIIEKNIDLDKIYNSSKDFGLITYSFKDKKPLEIFKNDIPQDEMVNYLLASSCFPIYKSQKIGETQYIDGGFYDNMPINMLVRRGYKNIIVIDVSGIGLKRKLIDKNVYIKMIRTNENLGGTFDFNKDQIKKNIELGYLDTLRSFNRLQGHIYYFPTSEFNKLLQIFNLRVISGLEYGAKIYKMEYIRKYSADEFLTELTKRHKEAFIKYTQFRKDLDLMKIIKEYSKIRRIINKGFGLCFIQDLFKTNPTFKTSKILNKLFEDYIIASDAMMELENYK